jgi:glycosyltransferase involved in cell wall biosynthesis
LSGKSWRGRDAFQIRNRIEKLEPDIVHVQYPTVGYGHGLAPQLLSVLCPTVVTLHEVRHVNALRRLSLAAFGLRARRIVFTAQAERDYFVRFAPWLRGRTEVIPVGSSVPAVPARQPRREDEIVHFGLIRPAKGLEQVLELAGLIHERGFRLRVRVIGDIPPKREAYWLSLRRSSEALPIVWDIGASTSQVAEALASSRVGYLPFPDGASERRTSLLALLESGVATITTRGADTPTALRGAVAFAESPAAALEVIQRLHGDPGAAEQLSAEGRRYARRSSWERIAVTHRSLYGALLGSTG